MIGDILLSELNYGLHLSARNLQLILDLGHKVPGNLQDAGYVQVDGLCYEHSMFLYFLSEPAILILCLKVYRIIKIWHMALNIMS